MKKSRKYEKNEILESKRERENSNFSQFFTLNRWMWNQKKKKKEWIKILFCKEKKKNSISNLRRKKNEKKMENEMMCMCAHIENLNFELNYNNNQ